MALNLSPTLTVRNAAIRGGNVNVRAEAMRILQSYPRHLLSDVPTTDQPACFRKDQAERAGRLAGRTSANARFSPGAIRSTGSAGGLWPQGGSHGCQGLKALGETMRGPATLAAFSLA